MTDEIAELLRTDGVAGLTIRALADRLGVPVSNAQYRFGPRARLVREGVEALASEQLSMLGAVEESLPREGMDGAAIAQLMRYLTTGATARHRANSMVLLELSIEPVSVRESGATAAIWLKRLQTLWSRVAESAGRDALFARFLVDLHVGLMLHFCGRRLQFERSMVCDEIIEWTFLDGGARKRPWFRQFLLQSLEAIPTEIDTSKAISAPAEAILRAAVTVLSCVGPEALSYRVLGEAAGVSASAVAHHFPSRHMLVYAAYRFMHRDLIRYAEMVSAGIAELDPALAIDVALYKGAGARSLFLSYSAFELYADRNAEFTDLARFFRMTRGEYHLRKREAGFDPFDNRAFGSFAHTFALLGHVLRRTVIAPDAPDGDAAAIGYALDHFLKRSHQIA